MTGDRVFPDWIEDDYDGIRSSLSSPAAKSIDRFRSQYSRFQIEIKPLPAEVEMYEIYQISVERLQNYFPDAFSALTHCCEYLVGFWLYRHAYKMNAYDEGLKYSLSAGNWLIAFTCLRNMFEEVAHYDFYLSRIERNVKKIDQLEKNEAKRIKQGKRPSDKWIKDYISCDLEIIRQIEKAVQGSDFDWVTWIRKAFKGSMMRAWHHNHSSNRNLGRRMLMTASPTWRKAIMGHFLHTMTFSLKWSTQTSDQIHWSSRREKNSIKHLVGCGWLVRCKNGRRLVGSLKLSQSRWPRHSRSLPETSLLQRVCIRPFSAARKQAAVRSVAYWESPILTDKG